MTIWHPHTDIPTRITTAVIAVRDETDNALRLLDGIYYHRKGQWIAEENGDRIGYAEFWWAAEDDLLAWLPINPTRKEPTHDR